MDAITRILKDYADMQVKKPKKVRTSVLEKLKKLKAKAAEIPKKAKEKKKERSR